VSADGPDDDAGFTFPPPSTFRWGWEIPPAILEPLLRPRAADDAAPADSTPDAIRSADGPDAELPAG
jgi:hypothetical protein